LTITASRYENIDWLQLYEGTTLLGEIQVTGANATITPSNLIISQNSSKTLTLKAKTQKVGSTQSGTSGQGFAVAVTGVDAVGKSTGSTSGITKTGLNTATSNTQYIYATKPTVTKVSLSGMSNGTQDIYKFTLAADSKGDIGFYKATFAVTTTTATVSNFKFYEIEGSNEIDLSYNALTGSELLTANTSNADGKFAINVVFDTDGSATAGAKEMRSVGAGTSKSYVLRGDVTGWGTGDSIQVQMLGDDAYNANGSAQTIDDLANDNFIWSDLNWGNTSSTATKTIEWINGYKVFATSTQSF
jgi:hypothetical protein